MAKPERKSFKVTRNNAHLTVYPYKKGWRYAWREREGTPWRYATKPTKEEAQQSAWERLGEIGEGLLVWGGLANDAKRFLSEVHRLAEPVDYPAVLAFLESRRKSSEIVASVARFMAWKVSTKGEETRHLYNVRSVVEPMARHFAGRAVVDITPADLKAWWDDRLTVRDREGAIVRDDQGKPKVLSKKTANEIRGSLVAFWNWAVWDGIHPKEVTPAEKLPRTELGLCERRVLTPDEVLKVLAGVAEEWRPWVVLGAFAGLRPEEIAPPRKKGASKRDKRGIRAEEIDWRFNVIRIPAEVSKVGAPRIVPLLPAARAWLEWAGIREGMTGAVCRRNPSEEDETARLGREIFGDGWPQDALRHSYGSYRNAMVRSLPQVAEEMGTSETMLRRHYHNPKTSEEGMAWFALRPVRSDGVRQKQG